MNKNTLRFAALSALLLAGSCTSPIDNAGVATVDPDVAHPITVAPAQHAVRVSYSGPEGMMPDDEAKLDALVRDYLSSGGENSISVSAPEGPDSEQAISYFGERLTEMGVPRSRIMVGTHPVANGDARIEIGFISYAARTAPCGGWTDATDTETNLPMPNFGCAVQHNIAAMVANPRDLEGPRPMDGAPDAARRAVVIGHYEKGEITQADKHTVDKSTEQSGVSSDLQ